MYDPDFMKHAEELNIEVLESFVPESRLHELISNPVGEGTDEA